MLGEGVPSRRQRPAVYRHAKCGGWAVPSIPHATNLCTPREKRPHLRHLVANDGIKAQGRRARAPAAAARQQLQQLAAGAAQGGCHHLALLGGAARGADRPRGSLKTRALGGGRYFLWVKAA
jgi:hypothetical protein